MRDDVGGMTRLLMLIRTTVAATSTSPARGRISPHSSHQPQFQPPNLAGKPFKQFLMSSCPEHVTIVVELLASYINHITPMADDMFRPPVNRAMRVLDRSFFKKTVPVSAARILDNKTISKCRSDLQRSKDTLSLERYTVIRPDPLEPDVKLGKKCILLRPQIDDKGRFVLLVLTYE